MDSKLIVLVLKKVRAFCLFYWSEKCYARVIDYAVSVVINIKKCYYNDIYTHLIIETGDVNYE